MNKIALMPRLSLGAARNALYTKCKEKSCPQLCTVSNTAPEKNRANSDSEAHPVSQLSWAEQMLSSIHSRPAVRLQRSCYTGMIGIILGRTHTSPGLLQNKGFFFLHAQKRGENVHTATHGSKSHSSTWNNKKHTKISRETLEKCQGMRVPSCAWPKQKKEGCAGLGNLLVTKKK